MTPSSTSEPEIGAQSGSGPTGKADPTPPDAPVEVVVTDESPDASPEPAATIEVPATEDAPAAAPTGATSLVKATPATDTPAPSPAPAPTPTPAPATDTPAPVEVIEEEVDDEDDYDEVLGDEPSDRHPTLFPLLGALVGLAAIAALMLVAFALPAAKSVPHRLPIGVSGPAEINANLRQVFTANGKAFTVTSFTEEAKLRAAIEDRKIYGGLSVTDTTITMLVSSAASPVATETLSSVANGLSGQLQTQVPVTDVVAMPDKDARGEGLSAANLPLVLAAVLPALLIVTLYRRRTAAQIGVAAGASVAVGLGLAAVLTYVVGSTQGSNFLLVSVGLAAGVLATTLFLLGLFAVAGRIGLAVGAVLLVFFAGPLSGLSTAPEWLPTPWGTIGQLLPAGANATLLRSTAYFDGHGGGESTLVLAVWALLGLLLIAVGTLLARRSSPAGSPSAAPVEEPVSV